MVWMGHKAMGWWVGGALVKAPEEKWGEMGEMGGKGKKCGEFWMLDGEMGNLGAEKVKKHAIYDLLSDMRPIALYNVSFKWVTTVILMQIQDAMQDRSLYATPPSPPTPRFSLW